MARITKDLRGTWQEPSTSPSPSSPTSSGTTSAPSPASPSITSGATGRSKPPELSPPHWGFGEPSSAGLPTPTPSTKQLLSHLSQWLDNYSTSPCADCGTTMEAVAETSSFSSKYTITFLLRCPKCGSTKPRADILACMNVPFNVPGYGLVTIPSEVSTGWNWGDNPYGLKEGRSPTATPTGLKEFEVNEADPRVRPTPVPIFNRPAIMAK